MTSSALRDRSARPCSPSAQRSASARLLLPEPFGPTTALMPLPNSTTVRSANDLKPCSRRPSSRRRRRPEVEAHARDRLGRVASRASRSIASAAAAVSATRRDGPSPTPRTSPATVTSIRNDSLVVGPGRLDEPVDGPVAGRPLGVFLEPALGALQGTDRAIRHRAPGRPARPASRGPRRSRGRGRARRRAPRRTTRAGLGRLRPSRWDSPSPSSSISPRSIRAARRARPAVETIAARRADRSPSSSSGWRA